MKNSKFIKIVFLFVLVIITIGCKEKTEPIIQKKDPPKKKEKVIYYPPKSNIPKDSDYFVTEWQGGIKIEKIILGSKHVIQYREKGSDRWKTLESYTIIYRPIGDEREFYNQLLIEHLDKNKLYELRTLNVDYVNVDYLNKNKITTLKRITQWGTTKWINMNYSFRGCENLEITAEDIPDLSKCKDCSYMFKDCKNLTGNSKFNQWDVSNINDMRNMFEGAVKFNQNISKWNVRNVTNWSDIFSSCPISNVNKPIKFR